MRLVNFLNDCFLGFLFLGLEVLLGDKLEDLVNKHGVHDSLPRSRSDDADVGLPLDLLRREAQNCCLRVKLLLASTAQLLLPEYELNVRYLARSLVYRKLDLA